ncbi:DNA repair protein RadC [bacterium]|nr:DNA repair protein RadC [bacterium]
MTEFEKMRLYSDLDLIKQILNLSEKELHGGTVKEILDHLSNDAFEQNRAFILREIAERYGEKRLQTDDSFSNSNQVYQHYRVRLSNAKQESFYILILNNKHRIIGERMVSLGTINQSLAHPREIFAPAIELRAAAIIVVHNHPTGDPTPSAQDIKITKRLIEAGNLLGVNVLDHVIIGQDIYFSFADENIMSA